MLLLRPAWALSIGFQLSAAATAGLILTAPRLEQAVQAWLSDRSQGLAAPALDWVLKCSHTFNLLEARGVISVTERTATIGRIRTLARQVAESWLAEREALGFPLLKG